MQHLSGRSPYCNRAFSGNDDRIGPFGIGWTHAYDIRMEEDAANTPTDDSLNFADRTDFFGGKHKYHRDADGLYSPPAYLYDEMSSDCQTPWKSSSSSLLAQV